MPRVNNNTVHVYAERFLPLFKRLLSLEEDSYVVVEVSGTALVNFMVIFRETLARIGDYPHWDVRPINLGDVQAHELLIWWRRHQLGIRQNEPNCVIIKSKATSVPSKQYHIKFDFYEGIQDNLDIPTPSGGELSAPSALRPAQRFPSGITRSYEEGEYRAFHYLKSRSAIPFPVLFLGVKMEQLPSLHHPNVPVLEEENETIVLL